MRFWTWLVIITIVSGCANFKIEKRTFRKGYYISWSRDKVKNDKQKNENNDQLIVSEEVEAIELSQRNPSLVELENDEKVIQNTYEPDVQENQENEKEIVKNDSVFKDNEQVDKSKSISVNEVSENHSNQSNSPISAYWFLALFGIYPLIHSKQSNNLAKWARKNPKDSRAIMTTSLISLSVLSFGAGALLQPSTNLILLLGAGAVGLGLKLNDKFGKVRAIDSDTIKRNRNKRLVYTISNSFGLFQLGALLGKFQAIEPVTQTDEGWKIGLFVTILILLTITLIATIVLACALTCSDFGFWAFLTLFLGVSATVFCIVFLQMVLFGKPEDRATRNVFMGLFIGFLTLYLFAAFIGLGAIGAIPVLTGISLF